MVELWTIFLRTIFLYFFILVMMRLMGKREIGKLSPLDLIVSFMIADISALVLERNAQEPLVNGVVPILTLVTLQIVLSFITLKSRKVRNLVDGEPAIIIKNGKIQDSAMAKARYNLDDLLMQLRENKIPDVGDVEFAILEPSGKLSVFEKSEKQALLKGDLDAKFPLKPFEMPVPVIIEGKVQDKALAQFGHTRFWLKNQIQQQGYKDFKEIFYASMNHEGKLYIDRKDPDHKS